MASTAVVAATTTTAGSAVTAALKGAEGGAANKAATSGGAAMVTLESHKAALARERSVIEALRNTNDSLRREIEQRDELEEQMEEEIVRLTKALDDAVQQSAQMEKDLTRERAETIKAVKQKEKVQKSFHKAKEKHKELKVDIKKRKRAAFAAMADAQDCGANTTTIEDEVGAENGCGEKNASSNSLIGKTWDGRDSKHDLKWTQMFEELKKFKQEHGHCDVPARWKGSDPKWAKLACWVSTQRTQHKLLRTGKWTTLKPERVRQLQAVGFKWNGQPNTVTMCFDERIAQLVEYKKRNGDCNVPQKYDDFPGLGNFVLQQRKSYRLGELSDERIERLEAVGIQWSLRNRGGPLADRMKNPPPSITAKGNIGDTDQQEETDTDDQDDAVEEDGRPHVVVAPKRKDHDGARLFPRKSAKQDRPSQHHQEWPYITGAEVPQHSGLQVLSTWNTMGGIRPTIMGLAGPITTTATTRHYRQPPPHHPAWIAQDYPYMYTT